MDQRELQGRIANIARETFTNWANGTGGSLPAGVTTDLLQSAFTEPIQQSLVNALANDISVQLYKLGIIVGGDVATATDKAAVGAQGPADRQAGARAT
jgi:hypothetical protein